jgi:hypothetical protein
LRIDLKARANRLENSVPKARLEMQKMLESWQRESDLAGVRGAAALAKLPEAERENWRGFWADVEKTLVKAREKTPSKEQGKQKPKPWRDQSP